MKRKQLFKVGDIVEWDKTAQINIEDKAEMDNARYKLSRVYKENSSIMVVLNNGSGPYYQERFKLSKNSIVADIIKDL